MSTRILVVEDEAVIARDLQRTLAALGYTVLPPVPSGDLALAAVASMHPDLVLMDIRIQGAIDGIETAARIRDQHGSPVIYLTAHSDEATIARAKATGAYGYILKPFSDRSLRSGIEVALQKREFEQQLSRRERWFATTLASIGDAVIATDTEQRISFMNAVAERVTGWKSSEAEGKPLGEVLRLVDQKTGELMRSPLTRALREGFAVELPRTVVLSLKDGCKRAIEDTAAPIVEDGDTIGGVVVFRDVTERRQLEDRVAQSERLAAIGALSAGMADEINNPLAYVLTNVTFALEGLREVRERLRAIGGSEAESLALRVAELIDAVGDAKEGSTRVRHIVQDLKKFGRLDLAERSLVELSQVLDSAIRMTENIVRHHGRVRRDYKTTPFVDANDNQLGQVFINLLVNAAQALGEGDVENKRIVVATYTDDEGRAVGEVRDNGPGIPEHLRQRIFDPFFTTKTVGQGSGLGLSIAQSIVRSLGGEISVETEVGKGTTFRVALPAAKERDSARMKAEEPTSARRARVLVVDDEPAIGRAIGRLLARQHDVSVATDAREALRRIAAGDVFDVILCDLMMSGMTGMDFFETLRTQHPALALRVVFMTGGTFTPRGQAFLRSTGNATLTKPVDPVALRRLIADYAGGR